ncbi:hypothetical protein HRR83_005126 [Exophiala dermatitidis]|uniref:Tyrosine decarboxylase n=1 Tax=Exophiala dermatitidis TaxID=5970 RepID=A0AAN6EU49_EXODE|nr:hypothetical protein HRR75_004307 [Exophiala dermatitidis]KAJ4516960.1 hypothetical protein HRR74_004709 [Exophiala dermatitidis]KAJ4519861.1 hypothetical protein HRR73_003922 [Exophiala dermatitidis]KAJ4534330.1 hypothetical protein HRR76_006258 [Exophiala dermatitidis]KAJ4541448.1 hypothetical protein HRR77_006240 [Exophiala dermatitidis]
MDNTSLATIISTLQTILATTPLLDRDGDHDRDRRDLRVLPVGGIPDLETFEAQSRAQAQAIRTAAITATTRQSNNETDIRNGNDTKFDSRLRTEFDPLTHLATHLSTDIIPFLNLSSLSPNYYGFVTGGATPAALLGEFLASVFDQSLQVHLPQETIATTLEVVALNQLVRLFRLPEEEWGVGGRRRSKTEPDTESKTRTETETGQQQRRGSVSGSGSTTTTTAARIKPGGGGGTFTTGATASNVLGLALGREYVLRRAVEQKGALPDDPAVETNYSCGEHGIAELMTQAGVRKIQVLTTLPHSSIAKAASIVGIGRKNVVSINNPKDPLQIDLELLESEARKIRDESGAGAVLSILVVSAGEVNTGRFATDSRETMVRVRRICDEYGVWVHVDGAFGLFGRVLKPDEGEGEGEAEGAAATTTAAVVDDNSDDVDKIGYSDIIRGVDGLELADSITSDCHKLLNVPYDCGVFFTRHKTLNEAVFGNGNAAYLTSMASASSDQIQSPLNIGIENSRRFRALPVYCTLMAYGVEGYRDMLKRQIGLARRVTRWLLQDERFEVLPTSGEGENDTAGREKELLRKTFMVVLFRVRDRNKNKDFVKNVNKTGKIYLTGTVWEGESAARIAVSNWQVDVEKDTKKIVDTFDQVLK